MTPIERRRLHRTGFAQVADTKHCQGVAKVFAPDWSRSNCEGFDSSGHRLKAAAQVVEIADRRHGHGAIARRRREIRDVIVDYSPSQAGALQHKHSVATKRAPSC